MEIIGVQFLEVVGLGGRLEELAANLEKPRKIMMMVKAGQPVDDLIDQLIPYLEEGDILIDGGRNILRNK